MQFDVVTLGETMVRLTPPNMLRLEQTTSVDMHVGGSETNTAVGLCRLGHKVVWLSRMTDNTLGRHVVNSIQKHSVCSEYIRWTSDDRVGLYFLEVGKQPRSSQVLYDRKGSAMANMQPNDLPESLFQQGFARLFHTTGITFGISESAAATATRAIHLAKAAGWQVSFDVNYRSGLWSMEAARKTLEPILQIVDIIFMPYRDANLCFLDHQNLTCESAIRLLAARYPNAIIVLTLGADGAIAAYRDHVCTQAAIPTETVERLGGGDAFSAGFLSRYLQLNSADSANANNEQDASTTTNFINGQSSRLSSCLQWGCSVAALKYTIPGDLPLIERSQVDRLLGNAQFTCIQR